MLFAIRYNKISRSAILPLTKGRLS